MNRRPKPQNSEFLLYETEDGQSRIDVRVDGDTAWRSLMQMVDLFGRDKSVISRHIKNVFEEGELRLDGTVASFATVQADGAKTVHRDIEHYNLDVIISVGYRVKSLRGTQFAATKAATCKPHLQVKTHTNDRLVSTFPAAHTLSAMTDERAAAAKSSCQATLKQ